MNTIINKYSDLLAKHTEYYEMLVKRNNLFGLLRFLIFAFLATTIVLFIKNGNLLVLGVSLLLLVAFLVSIKIHVQLQFKRDKEKALMEINKAEIDYLNKEKIDFYNGSEFINPRHPFSFDLDFFGKDSLYQNINRTESYIGQTNLAGKLTSSLSVNEIIKNQEAISDLTNKIEFRQNIAAIGKIAKDNREFYNRLLEWSNSNQKKPSRILTAFSFLSPLIIIVLFVLYFTLDIAILKTSAFGLVLVNLGILSLCLKRIKREIVAGTKIDKIIKNYSLIISTIENENFTSDKLNQLKGSLIINKLSASRAIRKLSSLFSQLDTLFNLIGAMIANGLALQHIHVYRSLMKWKRDNSENIKVWLDIIGEFETFACFANFSYNNPEFSFPEINQNNKIEFKDLGHPLINSDLRVNNDVDFNKQRFIILTGSNMAGKSTFLRSLGVNMVLAGIGSVVCASSANVHPMKVWVSMRLSDSLEENESYFYAEVKRLKEIMDQAGKETTFILLDEILRGTNSEDKHYGSVEVIKKLISKNAIGAIATHDLKLCYITDNYPDNLVNKCFEVEIENDELFFDYKLRGGVCNSKNATFLMEKMGVI